MAYVTHHGHGQTPVPPKEKNVAVDFASERAGEVAAELGLTAEQLAGVEGTGTGGALTVKDVRGI